MARREVVEVECGRCERVSYVPKKEADTEDGAYLKLEAIIDDEPIQLEYKDLCDPCKSTVSNLISSIAKTIKGKSPDRKPKAKKGADEGSSGPEVTVTTQPPKPPGPPPARSSAGDG